MVVQMNTNGHLPQSYNTNALYEPIIKITIVLNTMSLYNPWEYGPEKYEPLSLMIEYDPITLTVYGRIVISRRYSHHKRKKRQTVLSLNLAFMFL